MNGRAEPAWLSSRQILRIHEEVVARHGGSEGIRDEGLLDSALSRAQNAFAYEDRDLFYLAALHAEGIVRNHPFVDGNKRTGYAAAAIFLMANGYELRVADDVSQRVAFFE